MNKWKLKRRLEHQIDSYVNFFIAGKYGIFYDLLNKIKGTDDARYVSIRREWKRLDRMDVLPVYPGFENVGVVIQGPICKKDNFTLESVRMLRKLYPDIKIVLSTWEGELTDEDKEQLKTYSCLWIENPPIPILYKGKGAKPSALKNQLTSSREGIRKLEEYSDVDFVVKIRSDMRIYKPDFIPYMVTMQKMYPDDRMIVVSFSNNMLNIPFHMSDFIWAGCIGDMKKLYSAEGQTEEMAADIIEKWTDEEFQEHYRNAFKIASFTSGIQKAEWWNSLGVNENYLLEYHEEIYLAYNLCKHFPIYDESKNLLEMYYDFIRSKLIVIDEEELHCYWNKDVAWNFVDDTISYESGKLTHSVWVEMIGGNTL